MTVPPGYREQIGLKRDNRLHEIGSLDLLHAFNSTIVYHLEQPQGWGSRFPTLMIDLHDQEITAAAIPKALDELDRIEAGLRRLEPRQIIGDIEQPGQPPVAGLVNPAAANAAEAFVSPNGIPLLELFRATLKEALVAGEGVRYAIFYERIEADGSRSIIL